MTITLTAQDGTGDLTSPVRLKRYDAASESANRVTELIEPGSIAVTLYGDLPPAGTFTLLYTSDAAVAEARALLGRATTFQLEDSERPVFNMRFARLGRMAPSLHDELDDVWMLEVGFQAVEP